MFNTNGVTNTVHCGSEPARDEALMTCTGLWPKWSPTQAANEYDPITGEQTKPADPTKRVEK